MSEPKQPDRPPGSSRSPTTRTCAPSATGGRRRSRTTTSSRRSATSTASGSPSASSTPAAPPRSATSRPTGTVGDEPISKYTRAKLFQEKGKQTDVARALLDRRRRPRLLRGRARPARLRGEVLHRGRQLGPRRQQPRASSSSATRSSSRTSSTPRSRTRSPSSARSPNRVFDFVSPDARGAAHGHARLRPARHPGELPAPAGLRRQHLQVGQRGRRDRARQVPLAAAAGRRSPGPRTTRGRRRRQELGVPHQGPLRRDRRAASTREWELYVQIMERRRAPRARLRPARRHEGLAGERVPAAPRRARCSSTATPENFFAETEQIAFGTGVLVDGLDFSDDKMLVGRTFSYSDTQRHRVGPNYLQLPVNQPRPARSATNQRDGRWPTTSTAAARTRRSTTSRRSPAA